MAEATTAREEAVNTCATAEEASRTAAAQVEALAGKLTAAEATAAQLQGQASTSGEATTDLELKVKEAEKARDDALASAALAEKTLSDMQLQSVAQVAQAGENEARIAELQARLDVALRAEEESAAQLVKLRERGMQTLATYLLRISSFGDG